MKRIVTAIVVASALATTAAAPVLAMDEELTMLERAADGLFAQYNVDNVDVMALTLTQLAQIKAIADSDRDTTTKKSQIEAVIAE